MMNNIGQGNFMFQNMGVGDDAANRMDDMRQQTSALQPTADSDGSAAPDVRRAPRRRRGRGGAIGP